MLHSIREERRRYVVCEPKCMIYNVSFHVALRQLAPPMPPQDGKLPVLRKDNIFNAVSVM